MERKADGGDLAGNGGRSGGEWRRRRTVALAVVNPNPSRHGKRERTRGREDGLGNGGGGSAGLVSGGSFFVILSKS